MRVTREAPGRDATRLLTAPRPVRSMIMFVAVLSERMTIRVATSPTVKLVSGEKY